MDSINIDPLRGYCIGALLDYDLQSTSVSGRKWIEIMNLIREVHPFFILWEPIFKREIPGEFDVFKRWWSETTKRVRDEESATLVVVDDVGQRYDTCRKLLHRIEEEEWDMGVDGGVQFTTMDNILNTVRTGADLLNTWGDVIHRCERPKVFHRHSFVVADIAAACSRVERSLDEIKGMILVNGGTLLKEEIANDKNIAVNFKACFIVSDGTEDQVMKYVKQDSLTMKLFKLGITIIPVNFAWVDLLVGVDKKCNYENYPILFKPQPWQVQQLQSKLVISVSGFSDEIHDAIVSWLRVLGATYAETLSSETTHLICSRSTEKCYLVKGFGIHMVPLDWMYHIMQHGYEHGSEQRFLVNTKITFCHLPEVKETSFHHTYTTPLSKTIDEYYHQEDMHQQPRCEFLIEGKCIDRSETPQTLGLKHDICIQVVPVKKVKISIRDTKGKRLSYRVQNTMSLSKLFDRHASRNDVDKSRYNFLLDGKRIVNYDSTPWVLGMENGSIIDAIKTVTIDLRCIITDIAHVFRLRETTPLSRVFVLYARNNGIEVSQCEFSLCGKKIDDYSATPQMLHPLNNSTITVSVQNGNSSMEE